MAFDNSTRNKLASMVTRARKLLSEEFSKQLQELYGIQPDGSMADAESLTHLDEEQLAIAEQLRQRIRHLASGLAEEKKPLAVATDRLIREQAFTILNRFAALRLCEERGLLQECVRQGMASKGFQVYLKVAGTGLGDTFNRYRTFLFCVFDEIAVDLGILFDSFSPYGLLFPRETVLLELLELIDSKELGAIWTEDETIGWIYQYFNSKEERQAMRKASSAPRNSRELAVRNQFFTPRYVVEFLTDNTLGRIWYEMRHGDTSLKESCDYLVRRPHEVFLNEGEIAPETNDDDQDLSQEELLKQPHYIPFRPKKDPRDILMLDPAGGSGHFGLYCFDLYERIYKEAWDDPDLGPALHRDYADQQQFERDIPRLILMHNIHIIDIDPRAVQIAALALWLRAQRSWQAMKLKPAERTRITKTHIVCAEPMPGEKELLQEFTQTLDPPVLGQIVERIFDQMKLAGEAGSLLKIEEEIQDAISEAKSQWQRLYERARDKKGNEMLFTESEMDELAQRQQLIMNLFDVSNISDAEFWDTAEERILQALQRYAEQAENGQTLKRRLFSEDTVKGFSFIDLCRIQYDVVVMNPPFGDAAHAILGYFENRYNLWTKNLLCAFIIRAIEILKLDGLVGVIFDRTAAIKSSYERFRREILDSRITVVADSGWNVLDANVETTIHVLSGADANQNSVFIDIREVDPKIKPELLEKNLKRVNMGEYSNVVYVVTPDNFLNLPNAIVGYYFSSFLIRLFKKWKRIIELGFQARQGHALVSDEHFRLQCEIQSQIDIGVNKYFSTLYNGAEFTLFLKPHREVTVFGNHGDKVAYHKSVVLRNFNFQFENGIGYGKRGEILDAHVLSSGSIFTSEGQAFTKIDYQSSIYLLAFLNSSLAQYIINQYCGQHKHCGYINLLPFPQINKLEKQQIIDNVESIISIKREWFSFDETTFEFRFLFFGFYDFNVEDNLESFFIKLISKFENDSFLLRHKIALNDTKFKKIASLNNEESDEIDEYIKRRPNDSLFPELEKEYTNNNSKAFILNVFLSHIVGLIFGRWDFRFFEKSELSPQLPVLFAALPQKSPITLLSNSGYNATSGKIVSEEWLRARPDANTLPPESSVKNPTISDDEYPIRISWDGILVDDATVSEGHEHQEDIIRRLREVLDVLWGERAASIEAEACEILGVSSLRDYFRKPSGFFQDHLKRYSKSRRQAPIYWPLSSINGTYTLWIYYHRLDDQFLFKCVNDHVDPRLQEVDRDIERLHKDYTQTQDNKLLHELETLQDFSQELQEFRDELLRVAQLPYKPNLNDGVLITAAPLWQLFRLPKWRKSLKECWEKLEAGDYDWAHLAYSIWPERVREVCKRDKSIAIAHDLEELYVEPKK